MEIEQETKMNHEEFLSRAEKLKVSKIARRAIITALDDLVPTQDFSPREVEMVAQTAYEIVLEAAKGYVGRYNLVPNIWLSKAVKDCIPYGISHEARQELLHIGDVIEAVRRERRS